MSAKSVIAISVTAALSAAVLSGCSSVAEMPYPKLSDIVPAEGPSLSKEEKAAMIEELKQDQKTHKDAATADIESR